MAWWQQAALAVGAVAAGSVLVIASLRYWRTGRRSKSLRVENWEKDKVYLFNFPSSRTIVSVSPFALKVETWLRMRGIRHQTVRRPYAWSSKGQIPFVELNGEEVNESNIILKTLRRHFDAEDASLTQEQLGQAHALQMMLEQSTVLSYFYYRYTEASAAFLATWEYVHPCIRRIVSITLPRSFEKRANADGIGRHGVAALYQRGFDDLLALSKFLGDKKFLFGDEMTTTDCYAFGHLAQILHVPVDYPHKPFMRERTANLCDYTERIRQQLWPDWQQVCVNNVMGSD